MDRVWAQNLRQGIDMKTSFESRVSSMGLGSFVDIYILLWNIFYLISSYTLFFNLFNKNLHKLCCDPKKETREFRSAILF